MQEPYMRVVKKDGSLRKDLDLLNHIGDFYETVEELYGMIWYLAHSIAEEDAYESAVFFIEDARKHYKEGLGFSPTKRFSPPDQE